MDKHFSVDMSDNKPAKPILVQFSCAPLKLVLERMSTLLHSTVCIVQPCNDLHVSYL